MYSLGLVFLLVCPFAASANALNFTSVYEWNEFKFTLPDNSVKSLEPSEITALYLAVSCEKVFLGIEHQSMRIPGSLAWLPTNATSTSPQLYPYPSWEFQERANCQTIQSARGLTVDSVDRLWVLDNDNIRCPAKVWIFNLRNDSVEFIHEFPHDVVSHNYGARSLHDLVLDETENGSFAYISVRETEHFLVFDLTRNRSWRVQTKNIYVHALALSPQKNRTHLFVSHYFSRELFSISVSNLRAGEENVTPISVGQKSFYSNRLTMDDRGLLYFDLWNNHSVSVWNSSESFHEKQVYQSESIENKKPITFSLDDNGYFWVMAFYTNEPKIRIHKAAVSEKSSLKCEYDNTTPYYPISTEGAWPKETTNENIICNDKYQYLSLLNIVYNLFSTVFLILLYLKMNRKQDRIAETNDERDGSPIYDDVAPPSLQMHEEIGPRSTSARRRRAESRV